MQKTISIIVLVSVIVVGILLAVKNKKTVVPVTPETNPAMTGGTSASLETLNPGSANPTTTPSTGETVNTVKSFTVTGSNFKFDPSVITVNKGDTVKITFKNTDGFHDFKIDEFNVATAQIKGGASEIVNFVADKTGSFEYYCSVGQHRAMGMKGTLIVK